VKKLSEHPNLQIVKNAIPTEVHGEKFVTGISYKDAVTGEIKKIDCGGVFVEIGQIPATDLAKGLIEMTDGGQIKIDPRTQKTSVPGVWAAGDCTNVLYHQNNIAAGDAVRALEDIYLAIHAN
jgi:alkyl hydroperoxide reductase subunit F